MRQIDSYFTFSPTTILHHYTGIGMLLELGKKTQAGQAAELWASHVNYLNDAQEVKYAVEVAEEAVGPAFMVFSGNDDHRWFVNAFKTWLPNALSNSFDMFVFSLSEHRSLLSQWRSYTPHGKGVSVAFSPQLVQEIAVTNDLKIGKCIYEFAAQRDLIDSLIQSLWITWQHTVGDRPADDMKRVHDYYDTFRHQILQVLALIKHEAFKEEAEWRLISRAEPDVHDICYRQADGASLLTPFIKLKLPQREFLFHSVMLGPTPHQSLSLAALEGFVERAKLSFNAHASEIPFRKW